MTDDASRDLEDLYDYIEFHDAPEKADYVLDQIEKILLKLSENPERGAHPKELLTVGLSERKDIKTEKLILPVGNSNLNISHWIMLAI